MRTCTHGHLSEWAALVGEELPDDLGGDAVGPDELGPDDLDPES
ncbi:MAG: hypothetical protein ABEJ23_05825 [Haloarculaceae archaeon]